MVTGSPGFAAPPRGGCARSGRCGSFDVVIFGGIAGTLSPSSGLFLLRGAQNGAAAGHAASRRPCVVLREKVLPDMDVAEKQYVLGPSATAVMAGVLAE